MSNILNSKDFGLKIYNRFPPKYREDDAFHNYALKRYLQALSDGGFKYSIDEINGIADLIDPDRVDPRLLPTLFKQYGLELFNGIPEQYLRYLLPKLGEAWSKKGSLSVVEFVTSSLSGIKTDTNVTYDDNGNPIIGVRLEMDYSLGDYFPEAEQFTRLLENFVPFYSDITMLYSYLFYETQILVGREQEIYTISEEKDDSGNIDKESDNHKDNVTLNDSDVSKFNSLEDDGLGILKIRLLTPLHDTSTIKSEDCCLDILKRPPYDESGVFSLLQDSEDQELSAVLGEAIMGVALFGGAKKYSDDIKDSVTEMKSEIGSFSVLDNTLTNNQYNTLNSNFYTNGLHCYDIVTIGETVEILY